MVTPSEAQYESAAWTIATVIMILTSFIVIIIQRMIFQVFDYVFEICIFYIPTLIMIIIYILQKTQRTRLQQPVQ
jgi:hypothetical protein